MIIYTTQIHVNLKNFFYSNNPEAMVVNSDPQNDSVLLYDEESGGLKPLEESE